MNNTTKVFLNTWGAYNNGSIGYGWLTPEEAIDFMEENPEIDGGDFFIADIDNYTGFDFKGVNFDYENYDFCQMLVDIEELDEREKEEAIAIYEAFNCTIQEAIEKVGDYQVYPDYETWSDSMLELVYFELNNASDLVSRYFDEEAFLRDCMYDYTETSNGYIVSNY